LVYSCSLDLSRVSILSLFASPVVIRFSRSLLFTFGDERVTEGEEREGETFD
jgi:hypothetical protein